MLHIDAQALQAANKHLLLSVIQHVLGVKDGWSIEGVRSLRWVLLKGFIREDGIKLVTEGNVVHQAAIGVQSEVLLKFFVLYRRQLDSLTMEGASEFLSGQVPLTQSVEILEELEKSNPVFLHDLFDLSHEVAVLLNSIEVSELVSESRLGASGVAVDNVLEAVCVSEEVSVSN